jgi:hypothetical protein
MARSLVPALVLTVLGDAATAAEPRLPWNWRFALPPGTASAGEQVFDAARLAERLREQQILVKPLGDRRLGPGFMRVTTAQPEDNGRFVQALRALL